MMRGRSTGTPTKAQQLRFFALREIGCLTCWIAGKGFVPAEVHHLTIGGKHGQKRRGHDYSLALCDYCHRGIGNPADHGTPSLAREPRAFRERFGSDDCLLAEQNKRIDEWRQNTMGVVA